MEELAPERLSLRFRPQGGGRYAVAAFLTLWLTGWAAGELVALSVLARGLASLAAGTAELTLTPVTLAAGGFLVVWLLFWTLAGVAAIRQLLLTVGADDRLVLQGDRLLLSRRLGPFTSTRRFEAGRIERVYVRTRGSGSGALVAQLGSELVVLTDRGGPLQWEAAAEQLRRALGVPGLAAAAAPLESEGPVPPAELPTGWRCLDDPLGDRLLVPDPRLRRRQTLWMAGLTALVGAGAVSLARASLGDPSLWVLTLIAALLAALCLWGSLWLGCGRIEWRIEPRRLVRQRRFAGRLRVLEEARALELQETSDSDGDPWYDLRAIELSSDGPRRLPEALSVCRQPNDPREPRQLGLWLARQARLPFHDRVPSEAERSEVLRLDLETLRRTLPSSGRWAGLSRWLLATLERRLAAMNPAPGRTPRVGRRPSASAGSAREGRSAGASGPRSPGGG